MTKLKTNILLRKILLCLLALLLTVTAVVPVTAAFADNKYTYVIENDFADTSFNINDYPIDIDDYSVQIIQIAEDTNNGLVVYVYMPSAGRRNILPTSINIATEKDNYINYPLILLASQSAVMKFKVRGITVKVETERHYNISSVFRPWDKIVDGDTDIGMNVTEKSFPVGQAWTVTTTNSGVDYICKRLNIITVTDRFDGVLRYFDGEYFTKRIDRHFIAFSLDRSIDDISSVDVTYIAHHALYNTLGGITSDYRVDPPVTVHVDAAELFSNNMDWSEVYGHSWHGIETVSEFLRKETLRAEIKDAVKTKQWVLSYSVTGFEKLHIGTALTGSAYLYTELSDVTMLRLNFTVDGISYNVGIVDDKVTGDPYPVNWSKPKVTAELSVWDKIANAFESFWCSVKSFFKDNWDWVIIIGLIILAVILFIVFFPVLAPLLLTAVKAIGKAIVWLLMLPVRFVKWIIGKIKERKDGAT